MVREFLGWYRKWDEISSAPVTDYDFDRKWEDTEPLTFIGERVNLRGPTRDLEKAHTAILTSIHENNLKPSSIIFTSEGERKRIETTIQKYRDIADEIREELFSRSMAITIHEKMHLDKLVEETANMNFAIDANNLIDDYK